MVEVTDSYGSDCSVVMSSMIVSLQGALICIDLSPGSGLQGPRHAPMGPTSRPPLAKGCLPKPKGRKAEEVCVCVCVFVRRSPLAASQHPTTPSLWPSRVALPQVVNT